MIPCPLAHGGLSTSVVISEYILRIQMCGLPLACKTRHDDQCTDSSDRTDPTDTNDGTGLQNDAPALDDESGEIDGDDENDGTTLVNEIDETDGDDEPDWMVGQNDVMTPDDETDGADANDDCALSVIDGLHGKVIASNSSAQEATHTSCNLSNLAVLLPSTLKLDRVHVSPKHDSLKKTSSIPYPIFPKLVVEYASSLSHAHHYQSQSLVPILAE
ncbi:hypothetical protein C2S52_020681 [Perilla frutescens var. hirtella]|nr:hypothetical protein C2S52_020681 [Perilla frutescens var. hirtella]